MAIVLLQAGKGGGLAAMGAAGAGSDTLFGSRQAATLLTRATWWAGGIFLVLSFGISMIASRPGQGESILRGGVQPVQAPATAPALPGTFEAAGDNTPISTPEAGIVAPAEEAQGEP